MAIKLTVESFVNVVKQSNLVPADQLKRLLNTIKNEGGKLDNSRSIADELVKRGQLTRWQAEKLLQGKHKGFFLGKYRLMSLLGKGGMSSVYLADHVLMRRRCAIKVLPSKRVNDSSYLGRFHREAQAVASLDHPNIVRAYDVDKEMEKDMEIHFLVMEYVEGRSLQEIVQEDGPVGFVDAAEYIRQSASGLGHAHDAGMVHRDIKPGNLLVDQTGTVKLLDMGLARFFHEGDEESLTVAHDEKVLGTADYLAPEQALDSHSVDERADIYSLGCTLYFLLTGHPPFTQGTLAQRLMSHQTKEPPSVKIDRPDTPQGLFATLTKMMAKKVEDRYQKADDVAEDLEQWLAQNAPADWVKQHLGDSGSGAGLRRDSTAAIPVAKAVEKKPVAKPATPAAPVEKPSPGDAVKELDAFLANLGGPPSSPDPEKPKQQPPAPNTVAKAPPVHDTTPREKPAAKKESPAQAPLPTPEKPAESPAKEAAVAVVEKPAEQDPVQSPFAIDTGVGTDSATMRLRKRSGASSKALRRGTAQKTGRKPLVMIVGGLVAVAAIVALVMALNKPTADEDAPEEPGGKQIKALDLAGRPINVGPNGDLKTLREVVDYVRVHVDVGKSQTVQLEAGARFAEPLVLDNTDYTIPSGLKFTTDTANPAVIEPPNDVAAIQVIGTLEDLVIENLTLAAGGKSTAARFAGALNGLVVKNIKLNGYTKTGIAGAGIHGSNSPDGDKGIVFTGIEFTGADGSTAMLLTSGTSSVQQLTVKDCRFLGPFTAGISLKSDAHALRVNGCVFTGAGQGVAIDVAGNLSIRDFFLGNNTFHKLQNGVRFASRPKGKERWGFHRNLFVDVAGGDAILMNGDPNSIVSDFLPGPALAFNWSTAKLGGKALNIYHNNGRQEVKDLKFATQTPSASQFLAPTEPPAIKSAGQPASHINGAEVSLKPYIGGVVPR